MGELLAKGWAEGDGFRRAAAAPPKNSTPLPKTYFFKGKRVFPRGNSVALTKNLFFQGGELLANGWLAGLAGWLGWLVQWVVILYFP